MTEIPRKEVSGTATLGLFIVVLLIGIFLVMALSMSFQKEPTDMQKQLFTLSVDMVKVLVGGVVGFILGKAT